MSELIEIDGNTLEGGGQILRLSMAFSSLLAIPIKVFNIRGGRSKGGLRQQHLKGIQIANQMCDGEIKGLQLGSPEITYFPKCIRSGTFEADTQTAGSVALLLQVAFPIALFSPGLTQLLLKGGTNCEMAPPIDYIIQVFKPLVEKFGATFECNIIKRGYFPRGGGEVMVKIPSINTLKPINMTEFGYVTSVWGTSFVAGRIPKLVTREMVEVAEKSLRHSLDKSVSININIEEQSPREAVGDGSGILLFAKTSTDCILGSSALGRRGLSAKEVAYEATDKLLMHIKEQACVDAYSQDQIIILMALANGRSCVKCGSITKHTQTAIFVAEKLTNAKFNIQQQNDNSVLIECAGIGFKNPTQE